MRRRRWRCRLRSARVILQDFTGVPCVVDLAAMRAAMQRAGGDPQKINPLVPVDLVIDHSVQVDEFGSSFALLNNVKKEFERNMERYEFLKWGQKSFQNFEVVPPATGIVHQVNLEYLAKVVQVRNGVAYPDSLVGTDSHTTMINGLGVVGWGVGGIEAEACMLGQPIYMVTPQVVGFKLHGKLPEGATATDLVLVITQLLRAHGVVEKFVEFFGPGLASMSVADRATIANMAPEYGATMGFFPVDEQTLAYLRLTGREENHIDLVERYCKEQGLWRKSSSEPLFSEVLELDLGEVKPSLAGPKRPQDRVELQNVRKSFAVGVPGCAQSAVGEWSGRGGVGWRCGGGASRSEAGGCLHRRHHQLHEHEQSECDDRSGIGREESGRARVESAAACEDVAVSRIARRHGLLRSRGVGQVSRYAGIPDDGLWLHDLHRQLRPAAGAYLADDSSEQSCRRGCAFGESQLRRANQPGCEGELSGVAASGGGVCTGGDGRYRSEHRADRHGPAGQAGLSEGHLADVCRGAGSHCILDFAGDVPQGIHQRRP